MDTYLLSAQYAQTGNVDALYNLYDRQSHELFDQLAQGSRAANGREFFRRQVAPMLAKTAAMSAGPSNATARTNVEINGNQAVIHIQVDAAIAQLYPDVHLILEDGVWKLRAPEMFGMAPPSQPTVVGGQTPEETVLLAASFMREGKTRELYALYDSQSQQLYEGWASKIGAGSPEGFFALKMNALISRARNTGLLAGANAGDFQTQIDGNTAIVSTGVQMPDIVEFKSDMDLVRENGVWKLTMPGNHRARAEQVLAQ